jgi:hypothetical protein
MSDHVPDQEIASLELALKGLTPAAVKFDRDQLFFAAGQASARSRRWFWPATSALLALTTGVLGTLLALQPEPQTVIRVVSVPGPAVEPVQPAKVDEPASPPQPKSEVDSARLPGDYLRLRDQVLRWGVDMLPDPGPLPDTEQRTQPTTVFDFVNKS